MKAKNALWHGIDLDRLFYECRPFNGYTTRMQDREYGTALARYMTYQKTLEHQIGEEQIRLLRACIDAYQFCLSFETRHYFREGFLKGTRAQQERMAHR